jgi:hypothetical protein
LGSSRFGICVHLRHLRLSSLAGQVAAAPPRSTSVVCPLCLGVFVVN